jgi:2-phospho-L-lactate guanylyltransferase
MKLWLIVPVKPFDQGKSRLAPILEPAGRATLNRQLLAHVLSTAQSSGLLAGMLVISRDERVLLQAQTLGADILLEMGDNLNMALVQASQQASNYGADAVLVLPADLPLLTVDDIRQLHGLGAEGAGVVIAPSHDGGTNALLLRPPGAIKFAFGPHSFLRHCALAEASGGRYQLLNSPTLAFDMDRPEDWLAFMAEAG